MTNALTEQLRVVRAAPQIPGVRVGRIVSMDAKGQPLVDFPGNPLGPQRARCAASLGPDRLSEAASAQQDVLLMFEANDPARPLAIDVLGGHRVQPDPVPTPVVRLDPPPGRSPRVRAKARLARITGIEEPDVLLQTVAAEPCALRARTAVRLRNLKDEVLVVETEDGRHVIVGQLHAGVPIAPDGGEGADLVLRGARVRIEADAELVLIAGACKLQLDARGKAVTTADQIVSRARGANKVQGGTVQLN